MSARFEHLVGVVSAPAKHQLPPPTDPMAVARNLIAERYGCTDGKLSLRHWRGGWWRWCTTSWMEIEERAVREDAYRFTEHALYEKNVKDTTQVVPWEPNRHKIGDLLDAMAAICFLPETVDQPAWIDGAEAPSGMIVACANGLLHVDSRTLLPHDPRFFNQTAVPFPTTPKPSTRCAGWPSSTSCGRMTPSRLTPCRSGSAT